MDTQNTSRAWPWAAWGVLSISDQAWANFGGHRSAGERLRYSAHSFGLGGSAQAVSAAGRRGAGGIVQGSCAGEPRMRADARAMTTILEIPFGGTPARLTGISKSVPILQRPPFASIRFATAGQARSRAAVPRRPGGHDGLQSPRPAFAQLRPIVATLRNAARHAACSERKRLRVENWLAGHPLLCSSVS